VFYVHGAATTIDVAAVQSPPMSKDPCSEFCAARVSAGCAGGPASQAVCESDCRMTLAGPCDNEYSDLIQCAEGQAVSCESMQPRVLACVTEEEDLASCIAAGGD
jgi:hypothetical protein